MKLFNVGINLKKVMITHVGLFFCFNVVPTAFLPSLYEMLVCNERTCVLSKVPFSGILPRLFIFWMKSVESLT